MNITTVSVTYGRKFNLGSYESATIEASLWADLEPGENVQASLGELWAVVKENVRQNALPLAVKRTEQVNEIIAGLPADLQALVKASLQKNGGK
jgi:hypothetical protein